MLDLQFSTFFISCTRKIITKILWFTKIYIFANLTRKIDIILIHSHAKVTVLLAVVICLFGSLREKRSVPPTE